jgi:DNA ligase (NAD+)
LSIPLIGKSASKDIAKACNDDFQTFIDTITLEAERAFTNIDGFGKEMNASLRRWWNENGEMCFDLSQDFNFKDVKSENKVKNNGVDLSGKTFVITGSLVYYKNRNELVEIIENFGAKVSGSVSAKTSFLINNDKESTSSKNLKAQKLGVPIISEQDFVAMIS